MGGEVPVGLEEDGVGYFLGDTLLGGGGAEIVGAGGVVLRRAEPRVPKPVTAVDARRWCRELLVPVVPKAIVEGERRRVELRRVQGQLLGLVLRDQVGAGDPAEGLFAAPCKVVPVGSGTRVSLRTPEHDRLVRGGPVVRRDTFGRIELVPGGDGGWVGRGLAEHPVRRVGKCTRTPGVREVDVEHWG